MNKITEKLFVDIFLLDSKLKELKKQLKTEMEKDTQQLNLNFTVRENKPVPTEVIKKKA